MLGFEGAIQGSGMQGSEQSKFNPPIFDDVYSLDVNWIGLASLRAGFAADRLLFYFKGGYAGAEVDAKLNDNVVQDPTGQYFWQLVGPPVAERLFRRRRGGIHGDSARHCGRRLSVCRPEP